MTRAYNMAGAGVVTDTAVAVADADAATRLRVLCLSAAAGIRHECKYVLRSQQQPSVDDGASKSPGGGGAGTGGKRARTDDGQGAPGLAGCGEPLVQLLSRQAARLLALYEESSSPSSPSPVGPEQPTAEEDKQEPGAAVRLCHDSGGNGNGDDGGGLLVLRRLNDLISVAYSRFYAYVYKDLPFCWRQLYTDASILKFSYLFLSSDRLRPPPPRRDGDGSNASGSPATGRSERDAEKLTDAQLDEMVRTLDLALILAGAGGHTRGRQWIDAAFVLLEDVWTAASDTHHHGGSSPKPPTAAITTTTPPPPAKRPRLESPSPARTDKWQSLPSFPTREPFTPPVSNPIRRVPADAMGMAAFQRYLDSADPQRGPEPLILTGLVDDWPARADRPWDKPSYLLSRTFGGRRLVPVEVGRSYVDEGWGQEIVTFGEFLRKYIDPSASSPSPHTPSSASEAPDGDSPAGHERQDRRAAVAYLAQHQLLLQLPQLRRDILVPDHCYTAAPRHPTDPSQDQPELDGPLLNAWLGPPGTITPLHTDPYHNVLAQVAGRKYARLYSPQQTCRMRARGKEGGVEMGNTSMLDVGVVEGWDAGPAVVNGDGGDEEEEEGGEEFRNVPFVDCILEPGEGLYIPIGWWHYVRGLSISFSVSLWWN
ncbi:hypothetical protein VSDG_02593 [Cytospora chrysosperma]|uniref:JmjC domain-containing protein n=1 Tax=Cytospora chrysosperma TaxID=252740 RepID=A0A423WG04_CYTCH|nr:hypothetical protein VSDG_02593 [Valsa sordida]